MGLFLIDWDCYFTHFYKRARPLVVPSICRSIHTYVGLSIPYVHYAWEKIKTHFLALFSRGEKNGELTDWKTPIRLLCRKFKQLVWLSICPRWINTHSARNSLYAVKQSRRVVAQSGLLKIAPILKEYPWHFKSSDGSQFSFNIGRWIEKVQPFNLTDINLRAFIAMSLWQ